MPNPSYEILPRGGRCLLSYGDDEYKYKDKDKDKDKDEVHKRHNICYIFEKQGNQGYHHFITSEYMVIQVKTSSPEDHHKLLGEIPCRQKQTQKWSYDLFIET